MKGLDKIIAKTLIDLSRTTGERLGRIHDIYNKFIDNECRRYVFKHNRILNSNDIKYDEVKIYALKATGRYYQMKR